MTRLPLRLFGHAGLSGGLASQCAVCQAWPARPLCDDCVARFAPPTRRCARCALPLPPGSGANDCGNCLREPPPLAATFAAVGYDWPWSWLVRQYKFEQRPGWAPVFAGLLLRDAGVRAALRRADLIVPMPLAPRRLGTRGFNQAWQLARELARQTGRAEAADPLLLLRIRDGRPQRELDRPARLANVRGAYAVDPLRGARLAAGEVEAALLVDDVMTSGASLFAAAAALRAAGAGQVVAIVFARTAE